MADIEFDHSVAGDDPVPGFDMKKIINGLGALVSLALIAGLGWWGYHLLMRDVTGVPVVRALEGPMRIAPEDPGGASAQYQGLAVNNIAAVGEAEAPADRLVLAPKPTVLRQEDQTVQSLEALASTAETDVPQAAETVVEPQDDPVSPQPAEEAAPALVPDQAPDQVLDQASIIEATLKQLTGVAPAPDRQATADAVPAETPGVARSLWPQARPKGMSVPVPASTEPDAPASAAVATDNVASINPADIPAGTRLVQLGAFDSVEIAKAEWLKISDRFEDFMAGKKRVIEKAQSGGKVFYRLRAHGFEDLSDARRFCSALLAGKANCIPLTTR